MMRRSILNASGRERAHQSNEIPRRVNAAPAILNGKGQYNRSSTTMTTRLQIVLLLIFGMFGWVQWFIAVTRIHDSSSGGSGASVLLQQQLRSPPSPRQISLVHQLQLGPSSTVNEFRTVSHVSPRKDEFDKDWLGKSVNDDDEAECVPMHSWQLPQNGHHSCNLIHELSLDYSHMIGCGGDRCAFQIKDGVGHQVAFKTMR